MITEPLYLVINADMFGTPSAPGEHVDWSTPDVFRAEDFEDLVSSDVATYAGDSPHMIVMEVPLDTPGILELLRQHRKWWGQ